MALLGQSSLASAKAYAACAALALAILAGSTGGASAQALHGYCGFGCIDNGTNSPTTENPPQNFGFTVSGGPQTGSFTLDVLVPNNVAQPTSLTVSGTYGGTLAQYSAIAWTSGSLNGYLRVSGASPNNPIGAYLPSTQVYDPGATGYYVYQITFSKVTLQSPSNPNQSPKENLTVTGPTPYLPVGSYIVGYLGDTATANSGAIFLASPH